MMNSKLSICIAIPTYNRDDVLINTINECLNQTHPADEIIVVDQTEKHADDVALILRKMVNDGKIVYHYQSIPSLPKARNQCLQLTKCDIVLFIDDDVMLPNSFVERHLKNFVDDHELSAVAGGLDQAKGWPTVIRPTRWPAVMDYKYFFLGGNDRKSSIANFPGGNHSIKVDIAKRLGGYDERLYGVALREESDMAIRLYANGGKILFDPHARLLHLAVPTGGCRKKKTLDLSAGRSSLFFAIKHVSKLKLNFFKELWFSARLAIFNKWSLNNPIVLIFSLFLYLYYLIQIPFLLIFTKETKLF